MNMFKQLLYDRSVLLSFRYFYFTEILKNLGNITTLDCCNITKFFEHHWNIDESLKCYNITGILLHLYNITTSFEYYCITRNMLHSGISINYLNMILQHL